MTAYVISEVEPREGPALTRYRELAAASIDEYGGRYLVRGAEPDAVEGAVSANKRIVIVEFPDMTTARLWYGSDSYAEALAIRDEALTRRLLFVDAV